MTFTELSQINAVADQARNRAKRFRRQADTVSLLRRSQPVAALKVEDGSYQGMLNTVSDKAPRANKDACEILAEVWQDACPDILRAVELRLLSEAKRELVRYRSLQRQVANSIVTEPVENEPVVES